eukprot:TRINITY_DN47962_c0_g1_i1.p1 TRINITY_DN47962_c0_g1~~TRINITY_DN47962_c0_g1_i1.p1  ORF type:complete len:482 (+),score=102.71 TRINITY_DN47962_c0_g1_i1:103-1446(+)
MGDAEARRRLMVAELRDEVRMERRSSRPPPIEVGESQSPAAGSPWAARGVAAGARHRRSSSFLISKPPQQDSIRGRKHVQPFGNSKMPQVLSSPTHGRPPHTPDSPGLGGRKFRSPDAKQGQWHDSKDAAAVLGHERAPAWRRFSVLRKQEALSGRQVAELACSPEPCDASAASTPRSGRKAAPPWKAAIGMQPHPLPDEDPRHHGRRCFEPPGTALQHASPSHRSIRRVAIQPQNYGPLGSPRHRTQLEINQPRRGRRGVEAPATPPHSGRCIFLGNARNRLPAGVVAVRAGTPPPRAKRVCGAPDLLEHRAGAWHQAERPTGRRALTPDSRHRGAGENPLAGGGLPPDASPRSGKRTMARGTTSVIGGSNLADQARSPSREPARKRCDYPRARENEWTLHNPQSGEHDVPLRRAPEPWFLQHVSKRQVRPVLRQFPQPQAPTALE